MTSRGPGGRWLAGLGLLALALPAACGLALVLGPSAAGLRDLVEVLRGGGEPGTREILLDVRLHRVLLAALVGAGLAAAGAAFQATLRNPLADPFILGVSGGALMGAVTFTAVAGNAAFDSTVGRPLCAFAGGVLTLVVLFHLARVRGRTGTTTLLLIGVVLNALYSAGVLFLITSGDPGDFQGELFFLVGRIGSPPAGVLAVTGLLVAGGIGVLMVHAHRLNLLAFGEETASQLGIDVERTLWTVVAGASLLAAAAVAFSGLIGFVGLIMPHAVRVTLGPDHRVLVPASALAGASFLILADTVARTALAPAEVPVGVITTLIGGPVFLVLFLRRLRRES